MQIIPNPTMVVLQLFPFLLTLFGLYFIIFKPMLAYLEGREKAMTEGRVEAQGLQAEIDERVRKMEVSLEAARKEVAQLRANRRKGGAAAYDARIRAAREEAERKIEAALASLRAETEVVRAGLSAETEAVASQIASRVLGRDVAVG